MSAPDLSDDSRVRTYEVIVHADNGNDDETIIVDVGYDSSIARKSDQSDASWERTAQTIAMFTYRQRLNGAGVSYTTKEITR